MPGASTARTAKARAVAHGAVREAKTRAFAHEAARAVKRRGIALCAAVLGCAVLVAAGAGPASARTFYVSPHGSDRAAGTSPVRPWRTVARVNRARLAPGDVVLLRGGATFRHALMPPRSGRPNAPIAFGSYGRTRPRLPRGVWFRGLHDLKFDRLALPHASFVGHGDRIALTRSAIGRARMGLYANGSDWWIAANKVHRTGDSGLILIGERMTVAGNRIERTGRDRNIPWGKHGIYLRVAAAHVVGNTIRRFADNGISVRYRNSVIEHNRIAGGPIGIAWFQNDHRAGISSWIANEISGTTAAAIYVSPADAAGTTRESFVITGNRLRPRAGQLLNLHRTVGSYVVAGNEGE